MLQQIIITTNSQIALRPLLEAAIENQKKVLKAGLARTQLRLTQFERQYGMTSAEFERRLTAREIEETFGFTDWRMELGMLKLLQQKYTMLQEARFAD
jgi:hypothetical protein